MYLHRAAVNLSYVCAGDADMLADPNSIVPFQPPQWMDFEDVCPSVKLSMQDMAARRSVKVQACSSVRVMCYVLTA